LSFLFYMWVFSVWLRPTHGIASGRDFDSARMEVLAYIMTFGGGAWLILVLIVEAGILWDRIKKARKK